MDTITRNKEIIYKVYKDSLNKRDFSVLRELIAEDYSGGNERKGWEGFGAPLLTLIKSFPDIQWTITDIVGEKDKVFVKQKWQGTHRESFQNISPTGKLVSMEGLAIYILREGKIIYSEIHTDRLSFLQQLEVLPKNL